MALQIDTPQRPITVDEFDRMVEVGILKPDERVELVDGRLYPRPTMNAPHASVVSRITYVFLRRFADCALVWTQLPVVASDRSKPFPDVALVRPRSDFYETDLPRPEDVFAIVEVSDTMLAFDRGEKLRMYAKAGIGEYWIVNVNARTVEVCREAHDLGYGLRFFALAGQLMSFAAFPGVTVPIDELLGVGAKTL